MAKDNSPTESPAAASFAFQDFVESSRIIAETASDAIITITEDSTILFVNRAATNIFGYSTEEMLGAELTMLMPEYLRHLHRTGVRNYLETGKKHISWGAVELPGLHKSGKEISLELSFGEFRKDGVRFFTGIARDITRRKQDERRLALQHSVTGILAQAASLDEATPKLLATIAANLGWQLSTFWSVKPDQSELHCVANWQTPSSSGVADFEAASRRFHFPLGEGLPGKVWACKHPIWVSDFAREATFPRASLAALGNIHTAFAFPVVRGDEVLGVIELFSNEIQNDEPPMRETLVAIGSQIGQFIERKKVDEERLRALSNAHEARLEAESLTKQLRALQRMTDAALARLSVEEVLSESLSRMRQVLNVDTAAILLLRAEGDELVAWAAQGLEEEVELGVRIPVGQGFAGKVVEQAKPIIIDDINQADVYNPLLKEKGIKSLLGVPLLVEGRPIGVLHVGKLEFTHFGDDDVRLLELAADRIALAIENARLFQLEKRARVEAEGANRAKDEFLTILSHELRTPLTPIIGWVHMMQNGILPPGEFGNALTVINRNAYNLKRLINDLLDMSAILSGKMQIEETHVSLAGVLQESVETMRPYARDARVELRLESSDETVMVKGDRSRLNQTFCNVIHNAIKFSPAGGVVQVASEASNSEATISIKDQGQGITVEFLPHVFERFRQADGSRTRSYGGLGLGLSLVKSFVEAHRGSVEATSEGRGKGSAFIIKLPCTVSPRETAEKSEHRTGLESEQVSRRILIIEDQPDTLEMLAANFQTRGFETLLCNSAAEALNLAEREHVDVLISDIAMPGMDGLQLIRDLRQKKGLENTPAIALTGYASQKDAAAAIAAGFDLHLSKPIDPTMLADAVESLLVSRLKENP